MTPSTYRAEVRWNLNVLCMSILGKGPELPSRGQEIPGIWGSFNQREH